MANMEQIIRRLRRALQRAQDANRQAAAKADEVVGAAVGYAVLWGGVQNVIEWLEEGEGNGEA